MPEEYLCARLLSVENIQRLVPQAKLIARDSFPFVAIKFDPSAPRNPFSGQAMVIVVMDSDEILDEAIPEWLELAIICFQRYHSP